MLLRFHYLRYGKEMEVLIEPPDLEGISLQAACRKQRWEILEISWAVEMPPFTQVNYNIEVG